MLSESPGFTITAVLNLTLGQRTHEIGVRLALGSSRERVVRMILREGVILAAAGLVLGLIGAWLVCRATSTTLYDVHPVDLPAFFSVGVVLLFSALVAYLFPRAARRKSGAHEGAPNRMTSTARTILGKLELPTT